MPIPHLSWKGKRPRSWQGSPEPGFHRRRFSLQRRPAKDPRRPRPWERGFSWNPFRRGRPKRELVQTLVWWGGVGAILCVVALAVAFAWYSKDLPDPNQLLERRLAESTRIYDRTGGTLLYEIHGEQRRTVVQLDAIPDVLEHATVAVEDKHFYTHKGFDFTGFLRAVWVNVTSVGTRRPGGSTITQQFVKNSILTSEKKITRKIKELVLSIQLERKFSKEQILQLYLNEIPYGSNNYGVQAAAASYFSKDVADLTLAESALLAALPQAPTYYSPYGNNVEALLGRQKYILGLMEEQGYITADERAAAEAEEIVFTPKRENITAPHFVFYVRELLVEQFGESLVESGGLRVVTTLDTFKQGIAEEEVAKGVEAVAERYDASNGALVAMDPKNGDILAMVGSRDYFDIEHDGNVNVTIQPRQPGSSFKPVVYASAFRKGYTPETMLFDLTTSFSTGGAPYTPHNYDGREHGPLPMRKTLAGSLNIPAVKTLYLAGVRETIDLAKDLGYTTLTDPDRYGLSLVLGGGEVKLLEHVGAFSVFAREGLKHPSHAILRVEDKNGKVLFEHKESEERVLDERVARQINSILSDDGARSYIFGAGGKLTLPGRPVAAKTGTTNDFRDGWTVGYTPSLVAGVWVGNNDNSEMASGADGSFVAAPIWNAFMSRVLDDTPVETFKGPPPNTSEKPVLRGEIDEVTVVKVDKLTGRRIPNSCLDTYPAQFIAERTFKVTHTILHWVDKNNPTGDPPANPAADPQYAAWEAGVQRWAAGQPGYGGSPDELEEEDCDLRGSVGAPSVSFDSPKSLATITKQTLDVSLNVRADVTLDEVIVSLDDEVIKTLTEKPYSFTYRLRDLDAGFYRLSAVATDAAGQHSPEVTVTFNYLPDQDKESLYLLNPSSKTTYTTDDFPVRITAFASDPDGVSTLTWVVTRNDATTTIETTTNPTTDVVTVQWATPSSVGTYQLRVRLTDGAGRTTESVPVPVTVKKP